MKHAHTACGLCGRRKLSLASPDHVERDQRGEGANKRADGNRRGRAEEIGHESGLEAAERNHSAENEGPDSHDAPAHFVGDDALQDRVRG